MGRFGLASVAIEVLRPQSALKPASCALAYCLHGTQSERASIAIMLSLFFRVLLLVLISGAARGSAQNLVLGVLEDVPGAYAGEPNSHGVRVLFQKNATDWEAFPNNCPDQGCLKTISSKYPRELTWTIVFDGRDLGQVTGRTPKEFELYSHVGLQVVVSTVLSQPSARGQQNTVALLMPPCIDHWWRCRGHTSRIRNHGSPQTCRLT